MIEAVHISKKFGSFSVLSDVSFQVDRGQIYGLVGCNGAGKTTLMKILCGIYRPDWGSASVFGQPVFENWEMKRRCFFMTEETAFFPRCSLLEMRKFYQGYYPKWEDQAFYGLSEWFGIDPSEKISRFSKGMQRQAGLILAFSVHGDCLFLDEAFDGLDYTMRRQVKAMIRYYAKARDACLLVSSHNLQELEGLADSIGMLSDGALVFDGSVEQMKEEYQTCRFALPEGAGDLPALKADLLEQDGQGYLCILKASKEEAQRRLERIHARQAQVRPVQLEEFFRRERQEKDADWKKIFG